jgi:hypothetical protein
MLVSETDVRHVRHVTQARLVSETGVRHVRHVTQARLVSETGEFWPQVHHALCCPGDILSSGQVDIYQ